MNLTRLRSTSSLLLIAAAISAILFVTLRTMRVPAQAASAPTPLIPPLHLLGAPPPMGPVKMRATTGEPYSLTSKTTTTKKFTDGTWRATAYEQRLMRDSEGRERSELLDASGRPITITLTDPVAQTIVNLQPFSKSATVTHVPLPTPEQEAQTAEFRAKGAEYRALHPPSPDEESPLPPQTIAGVYAEGKRTSLVLHAAKMPDGQAVRVVEETWTAPDLKVALARTSDDPRGEKFSMMVTDLHRAEPDPVLFQIPPDYKQVERR